MKFKSILESLKTPVILLGKDNRVHYCNSSALELFFTSSYTPDYPEDFPYPSIKEFLSIDYSNRTCYWKDSNTGKNFKVTISDIDDELSDTTAYLLSFEEQPLSLEPDGTTGEMVVYLEDSIANWNWNLKTNELWWSPELYQILGLDPSENILLKDSFLKLVHPDDADYVIQAIRKAKQDFQPFTLKHRIYHKSGRVLIAQISGHLIPERDGMDPEMIGTFHNITYQNLQQEREFLIHQVFQNTQDGVVITDPNTVIVDANEAFARITDFKREELIGKKISILQSGWHTRDFYDRMWIDLDRNGYWKGELWDRRKNGELFATRSSISRIINNAGVVTNYIAIVNDITEKKRFDEILHNTAFYDSLTGLPNRLSFTDRLDQTLKEYHNTGKKLALMSLNLVQFRYINDTLGHHMGDQVLSRIGIILDSFAGRSGMVARMGGDSFALLVEDYEKLSDVTRVAENIIQKVLEPLEIEETRIYVGISIGISLYPDDGDDIISMTRAAEMAMYHAKSRDKHSYSFFSNELSRRAEERFRIESYLHQAIINQELEVHYQPKVSLVDFSIVGLEALIRWKNSTMGYISPDRFIPVAEGSGMIDEIGLFVLEESIKFAGFLAEEFTDPPVISVNVSGKQIQKSNFIKSFEEAMEKQKAIHHLLEFEITESSIMEDIQSARTKLDYFRNMGISISIDDFGTGYSSMSHLKKFPVDKLKIDKSFIDQIHTERESTSIVQAIISLAKSLSLSVVAEGVEKEEQLEILKNLKCDEIQGYYFSPPLKREDCIDLIRRNPFYRTDMNQLLIVGAFV